MPKNIYAFCSKNKIYPVVFFFFGGFGLGGCYFMHVVGVFVIWHTAPFSILTLL